MAPLVAGTVGEKPHVVCLAFPAQSHIKAMLKLAKLLHCKGFHITFVNTEFNHRRYLKNIEEPRSIEGLPDFRFESIPDGLPPSDANATQDMTDLMQSMDKTCLVPFLSLLRKLNSSGVSSPPVTSIVSDGFMPFSIDAAKELGIPIVLFWTISACSFMGIYQLRKLVEKGLIPLKDASYQTNGYLDTVVDWIPGMRNMRLKDFPTLEPTMNPEEPTFKYVTKATERASEALANVLHTYDDLEQHVLNALSSIFSCHFLAVGPLQLLLNQITEGGEVLNTIGYNLWKEEPECLQWLNSKKPNSVVYVNFGSVAKMPPQKLVELSWGLAKSNQQFLWIIRPDLVEGDSAVLPPEFSEKTKERGMIASWCPQEEVLNHPSVGGFLTHSGWNSTMESLSAGVPMICLPFLGDQKTNSRYSCVEWGIGMEMDYDVKRDEVEILVREVIVGEKGKEMKRRAIEWKKVAEEATGPDGSSSLNLDKMARLLLASRN